MPDSPVPSAVPAGEWHTYRRDHQLTGRSPLPGRISRPAVRWSTPINGTENECIPIAAANGRMDLLFTYGGCVVRTDGQGKVIWKSRSCGINAISTVDDLDGDGRLEIVCCTGYEVIVLAAESGEFLLKHYVGFPMSSGTQASTLLCHRFDRDSPGMHLIVPLMSAKEVLVFDFRGEKRNGVLRHTLWMDDAFHPTVAAADMDGDGADELVVSKLCGLYLFDVLTGSMKSSVRWMSDGERRRNYGLLQLIDIDGDGAREVVIVAERVARHIAVLDNDGRGNLTLLWDRFVEFIYPTDTTELRHTGNSVMDVDGDGRPELVVSLFNTRYANRWCLEVLDPVTGELKFVLPDRYLWGVQDFDGDGVGELLVGTELQRNPAPVSTIEVVRLKGLKAATLWSSPHSRFAGRGLRPSAWKSNFRPMQFGHDETWGERLHGGADLFYFIDGPDGKSVAKVAWNNGDPTTQSTPLGSHGDFVISAVADVDGDGEAECVLSENNGRILVLRPGERIQASWTAGFRLQLEGFSAARPGPTPVIYRASASRLPLVALPDNTNTLVQFQVDPGGRGFTRLWERPGRGWIGYDAAFHSAYVRAGNGEPELLAVNPERRDCSELIAFAPDGAVKRSWLFRGVSPPSPTRVGLYQWIVVGEGNAGSIVASSYRSQSMNSEETRGFDLGGVEQWRIGQYGEGEWGRGVGPWSASSILDRPGEGPQLLFLAKDHLCRLDVKSGRLLREPWILWRATNSVMNQPDWDFDEAHHADFGTEKDPFTAYGSPILVDIDRDGKSEILVGGCFGGFGVLRDDYSILWWKRAPFTDMMARHPGIADVYGDGGVCVGICRADGTFACLDGETGAERWEFSLRSTTSDIASCDIDGDGREEFIAATADGRLLAIGVSAAGAPLIKWSVELEFGLGNPVIGDVDGDGYSEILVVTGDARLVCVGEGE